MGGVAVIVPTAIPFSSVPDGGVHSTDLVNFYMKCDPTTNVNLATGAINNAVPPSTPVTYFAAAELVLG